MESSGIYQLYVVTVIFSVYLPLRFLLRSFYQCLEESELNVFVSCNFSLLDLMTITSHDTYIKLVVSSIDSSREGNARLILSKGLTASSEVNRCFHT